MNIPLARPDITNKERQAVMSVLKTPILSLGPWLPKFEQAFAKFIGIKHAIAVNSGTSALHLIVKSLGIKDGDEVITSPFTFISSATCVIFERARPVFVDIDPKTFNIDPKKIEKAITKKTRAILPIDVFGYPADWDPIIRIAQKYNLKIIEDSCEAIGSSYYSKTRRRWINCGCFGEAGAFAFYPNKQMTTGEGGFVVTNNDKIAELSRSMRNQGRGGDQKWLEHVRLGHNYRISEINCALGYAQTTRLREMIAKRAKVAKMYNYYLKDISEIILPQVAPNIKMSWQAYIIRLGDKYNIIQRDRILKLLRENGVGCNNYFPSIHLQPLFKKTFGYNIGDFPISEFISDRTIALPFYNNLTKRQIKYIARTFKRILKTIS
ncbi:MAG: DegT/DnrJ/EryC1/StrS family aminotransferase [Patescibacteria group bacterium]|nr:DegT/DnrJ/EryC1/StrS family aminotransferase [Patescibacteria group bacterium]MDD5121304.1 DegT/DnrJ/EryC1/StrS family aminotransferase [Patescibacteria group bacterium]MDD5221734.1 DegT/DnrJ/EryC1/StrS family aminotransferase [Patescibacteria group bacterium]MDD5395777.1 DegT/DnrJ/EryC1/StrS family aminotransferase [Patescibacteria group bacterium]